MKHSFDLVVKTDVLIAGSGLAAVRAAMSVLENSAGLTISMVSSAERVFKGSSSFSDFTNAWGIQYPRDDAERETLKKDIIEASEGLCDERLVETLVENATARVRELFDWGVEFEQTVGGEIYRFTGCFSSAATSILTTEIDKLRRVFRSVVQELLSVSRLHFFEGWLIVKVFSVRDGGPWILVAVDKKGKTAVFIARAVILCLGGGASIFFYNLNYPYNVGHGYRIAAELGLPMKNMEFVQFIFGTVLDDGDSCCLLNQKLLTAVREIYDAAGSPFLEREFGSYYGKLIEERAAYAPFTTSLEWYKVDLVFFRKSRDSGFAPLQIRLGELDWARVRGDPFLKSWFEWFDKKRKNKDETLMFSHCAHAFNGGVLISPNAGTEKPGLFVAGELATGMHGANRVGGTMLVSCMVFGEIAGRSAVHYLTKYDDNLLVEDKAIQKCLKILADEINERARGTRAMKTDHLREVLQKLKLQNWEHLSLVRSTRTLAKYAKYLSECELYFHNIKVDRKAMWEYYNCLSAFATSRIVAESAVKNEVSIGPHYVETDH